MMDPKRAWVRVSAVVGGSRWHLLDEERGMPWCHRVLTALPTTVVHAARRPGPTVCQDCLRAEQHAIRAADKAAKKERKRAARAARSRQAARPVTAGG